MNKPSTEGSSPTSAVRPGFVIGAVLLALAGIAVFLWHGHNSTSTRHLTETEVPPPALQTAAMEQTPPASAAMVPMSELPGAAATEPLTPKAQPAPASAPIPRAEPTAYTRQLVANLRLTEPLTSEGAAEWKANLQQLIAQGATAVPAIQEFLDKNVDI